MAFKHLDSRQVSDAQWDHVESLGVRDSYDGSLFDRSWEEMTVDEKRGYYLVMRGKTCPRGLFEDGSNREIYFYALCLDDDVFYFDIEKEFKGKVAENNFEHYWHIVRIEFPDGWSFDRLSADEFKQIVTEAFTAETYKIYTPDKVKKITVDFPKISENKICDREKRNKDDKK